MADQCNITRRRMVTAVEAARPDVVANVVETHAVCATYEHAGILNLLLHSLPKIRDTVVVQK